jgi:hypothetical protein
MPPPPPLSSAATRRSGPPILVRWEWVPVVVLAGLRGALMPLLWALAAGQWAADSGPVRAQCLFLGREGGTGALTPPVGVIGPTLGWEGAMAPCGLF